VERETWRGVEGGRFGKGEESDRNIMGVPFFWKLKVATISRAAGGHRVVVMVHQR